MKKKIMLFLFLFILVPKNTYAYNNQYTNVLSGFNDFAISNGIKLDSNDTIVVCSAYEYYHYGETYFTVLPYDLSYSNIINNNKEISYVLYNFDKNYKVKYIYSPYNTGYSKKNGDEIKFNYFLSSLDVNNQIHGAKNIIVQYVDGSYSLVNINNYSRYYLNNVYFSNKNIETGNYYNTLTYYLYEVPSQVNKQADFSILDLNKIKVIHFLDYNIFFKTFIYNLNSYLPVLFSLFSIILIPVIIRYIKRF